VAGPITPGNSPGSLDWPHRPTLVFSTNFFLTHAHLGTTSQTVNHTQIASGQARLNWSSFQMTSEKEGIPCWYEYSINLLLNPGRGCHMLPQVISPDIVWNPSNLMLTGRERNKENYNMRSKCVHGVLMHWSGYGIIEMRVMTVDGV
jgi:hypothetical protein